MKTYLEPRDVELMEKCTGCARHKLLIRLLFHLGCRVSEVLAIKISDVDFERTTITILHLKTRSILSCPHCKARLARRHRFCPACGAETSSFISRENKLRKQRILPVDKDTLGLLKQHISQNIPATAENSRLIFSINRHRAWQIVRSCALRAGIPNLINPETGRMRGVGPHRLRDAFAVNAMKLDDSGDGLRLLQEHLGHASFNTTARYRKIAGEEHRKWYERLWRETS